MRDIEGYKDAAQLRREIEELKLRIEYEKLMEEYSKILQKRHDADMALIERNILE